MIHKATIKYWKKIVRSPTEFNVKEIHKWSETVFKPFDNMDILEHLSSEADILKRKKKTRKFHKFDLIGQALERFTVLHYICFTQNYNYVVDNAVNFFFFLTQK